VAVGDFVGVDGCHVLGIDDGFDGEPGVGAEELTDVLRGDRALALPARDAVLVADHRVAGQVEVQGGLGQQLVPGQLERVR